MTESEAFVISRERSKTLHFEETVVAKSHHLNEQMLLYLIAAVLALILAIFNSYSEQVGPFFVFLIILASSLKSTPISDHILISIFKSCQIE